MPKFIVIAGKKQSGKTTSANYLKKSLEQAWLQSKKEEEAEAYIQAGGADFYLPSGLIGIPSNLVKITSFATPIKDFCKNVMGLTNEQIFGSNAEKNSLTHYLWDTLPKEVKTRYMHPMPPPKFLTARQVMQIFGTDIMRNFFHTDIWANAPFDKDWGNTEYVIIDDCRFPNEADAAVKHDSTLIRLTRDVLGEDVHFSEKALDEYSENVYDFVIPNHYYKNIDCLYVDLDEVVEAERF